MPNQTDIENRRNRAVEQKIIRARYDERQKTLRECLEMVGEYVEIPKAIPVRDNQELAKAIINLQEQGRIDGANNEKSRLRALLETKLEKKV